MTGLKCVATGWGMSATGGKLASKMQQVCAYDSFIRIYGEKYK